MPLNSTPYKLVNEFCKQTKNKTFCVETFKLDPRSALALDQVTLVKVAIDLGINDISKLKSHVSIVLSKHGTNPTAKLALQSCVSSFDVASKFLRGALKFVSGPYDKDSYETASENILNAYQNSRVTYLLCFPSTLLLPFDSTCLLFLQYNPSILREPHMDPSSTTWWSPTLSNAKGALKHQSSMKPSWATSKVFYISLTLFILKGFPANPGRTALKVFCVVGPHFLDSPFSCGAPIHFLLVRDSVLTIGTVSVDSSSLSCYMIPAMGIEDIPPSASTPLTEKMKDKGLALLIVLAEQTGNNNRTPDSVERRQPFAGGSSHHLLLEKDYRDRIIYSMGMEIQELKTQLKKMMGNLMEKTTDAEPSLLRQRSPSLEPPMKKVPRNDSRQRSQPTPM
ncbi:hypothetical protein TEA_029541 [Camellia sinensis var. sinensis]|uniref:Pectinesterase inhibitor domain-containing protein n=1 Tax=Camellia sinensis var. sinensis TaxID=542762 RepID=A0A4S4E857_CAMSN|nr:hypothetical protein TEA_029541 [Camellia sinensis var. sinensis]